MSANPLLTGLIGITLVLLIAAACIFPFSPEYFMAWVATAFMAATPTQVIIGLLWENNQPGAIAKLPQPAKGFGFTVFTILAGAIFLGAMLLLVSGGAGPTPMFIQYVIMTVVSVIWMVAIWHCWPFSLLSSNPLVVGGMTLVFSYLLAFALWSVFFDYSILGQLGHPQYNEALDPKGLFGLWPAMTFFVTTVAVIILHALFDFWPIDKLCGQAAQPVRGIISTLYILALSWLIRTLFVDVIGMEQVDYMVRVPVSLIFGTFLVSNMMQFSLLSQLAQPVKGLALTACAIVAALVMHELYALASSLHAGQALGTGPQGGFTRELWIASAMLGVTLLAGAYPAWRVMRLTPAEAISHV